MFSRLLSRGSLLAVGTAAAAGAAAYAWTPLGVAEAKAVAPALSPEEWRPFKLVHKEALTHGANPTVLFRFALPDAGQEVGLPVASCLLTRAPIGSEKPDGSRAWVIRPYTPISHPDEKGHFDLAIKVYHQPAPGKMSSHIDHLKVGGSLDLKGPLPKMSLADIAKHKRVGMLAGGSGLTPCLQVAEEALRQKLPIELSLSLQTCLSVTSLPRTGWMRWPSSTPTSRCTTLLTRLRARTGRAAPDTSQRSC